MKLRRAEIESFGPFEAPITLEFEEGWNVLRGANESGKSTLIRAIWTALTWRPTTSADFVTDMYPHGGGTPRLQVEFERDGIRYHLDKDFDPDRGVARLMVEEQQGETSHHEGERVERMLRDVLGMGEARGHNAYPSHHGLWPLLWVRQWESRLDPGGLDELSPSGRTAVARQLDPSMEGLLGGRRGSVLMDEVESHFEQFWTPTGRPVGRQNAEIVEAQHRVEQVEDELESLHERRRDYRETLDAYRAADEEVEALESDVPRLRERLETLEDRLEESDALCHRLEEARLRHRAAEAEAERTIQCVERRCRLRDEIVNRKEARERAESIAGWLDDQLEAAYDTPPDSREDAPSTETPDEPPETRLDRLEAAIERMQTLLEASEENATEALTELCSRLERHLEGLQTSLPAQTRDEDVLALERERAAWRERIQHLDGRLSELEAECREHVEAHGTDEALEDRRRGAVRTHRLAREEVERLEEELDELEVGATRQRLEQLRDSYESKRREFEEARRRRLALRARLQAADVEGLETDIAETEVELERARERLARLERRADTWKLLYRTLERTRRRLRSRILEPLRHRATELIEEIIPDATDLELDEQLHIESVGREGTVRESFEALSGGTREQIGLLLRIALADRLNDGLRYPLVLDEPLTATDAERFEHLTAVLDEIAGDVQILVATWNWRRYRHCGLEAARLYDLDSGEPDDGVSIAS